MAGDNEVTDAARPMVTTGIRPVVTGAQHATGVKVRLNSDGGTPKNAFSPMASTLRRHAPEIASGVKPKARPAGW
jgi:hypothetical protein